jgi:hypothetical protein
MKKKKAYEKEFKKGIKVYKKNKILYAIFIYCSLLYEK